jgi:hypothetical protein
MGRGTRPVTPPEVPACSSLHPAWAVGRVAFGGVGRGGHTGTLRSASSGPGRAGSAAVCGGRSAVRRMGWLSALPRVTGMARSTIGRGLAELRSVATDVAVIGFAGVAAGGRNSPPAMPRCWMICSSVNRLRFIRPSPLSGRGLYLYLEGFSGLRSPRPTSSPNRSTQCDDRGKDRAPTEPSPDAKPRVRRFVITESSSKRATSRPPLCRRISADCGIVC